MNRKDLTRIGREFYDRNRKAVARAVHYVPASPLIHLVFDVVFPRLVKRREYRKLRETRESFQFTFTGMPGRKSWVVRIHEGRVEVQRGEDDLPQMVINCSARDFIDLATGYLPEAKAMMSGRLAVNGGPATKMKVVMGLFS